jgi:hypothetical protein
MVPGTAGGFVVVATSVKSSCVGSLGMVSTGISKWEENYATWLDHLAPWLLLIRLENSHIFSESKDRHPPWIMVMESSSGTKVKHCQRKLGRDSVSSCSLACIRDLTSQWVLLATRPDAITDELFNF